MSGIVRAFPLTALQEGMLYHSLRQPTSGLYHGQLTATLEGPLDPRHFRRAWDLASERHEIFRTFFAWKKRERPLQVVREAVELPLRFLDWTGLDAAEAERRWATLVDEDRRTPFDLERPPLMRLTVARLEEGLHELVWGVHHAVVDGWSGELVLGEVLDDHEALRRGHHPERPAAPSYAAFVGWLEAQDRTAAEAWWRGELEGVAEPSPLPVPPTGDASAVRVTTTRAFSDLDTRAIREGAARQRVTPATLTVAGWSLLLARRTDSRDLLFGITVSERPPEIPGIEQAAGLYLSTLPARIRLPRDGEVTPWLHDVQRGLSEARAHSSPGLTDLRRWSGLPGPELIRSLVVFENLPDSLVHGGEEGTLRIRSIAMAGPSDLPLALLAYPGERLDLQLVHDPAQVSVDQAKRLLDELHDLLLRLAGGAEPLEVLVTPRDLPGPRGASEEPVTWIEGPPLAAAPDDVVTRIEGIARETPDVTALRGPDSDLTYADLMRRATRVADGLRSALPPGAVVGIVASHSVEAIVAMVGVLKAGCAYLPLDPQLPGARLDALLADADLVLVDEALRDRLGPSSPPTRPLGTGPEPRTSRPDESSDVAEDAPAYVIFTSGSTGTPKGVVVERRNLAWSTAARLAHYDEHPGAFLLLSPLWVDSSVAGIYWTLCAGGTLVIPPRRTEQDVSALGRLMARAGITHTLLVPSLHRALLDEIRPEDLSSLRVVVVAGEACPPELVRRHRSVLPGVRLFNEYGPSEATVWATVDDLCADPEGPVTIGRPVPGARVGVVDDQLRPLPEGTVGELVIGGPGIARGYRGLAEVTAERFPAEPGGAGQRLYRTGDRVRLLPDGRLEFLGRTDDQIKVRGHRVEPGEIERLLESHPAIGDAVVGLAPARRRDTERRTLTAWLTAPAEAPSVAVLQDLLSAHLPEHMVPHRFVLVDRLPRTAAGKVDRAALPSCAGVVLEPPRTERRVGPTTVTERTLASIWREVLGIDELGVHDDFFALGGDSLLSIRVISRAARAGLAIDPETFFEEPTIARLARGLETTARPVQDAGPVSGTAPLTPIQAWFFERITPGGHHWNLSRLLDLSADVDDRRVEAAVAALVRHHDALRLRFVDDVEGRRQVVEPPLPDPPLRRVELPVDDAGATDRMTAEAQREQADLDPGEGRLFRAVLFRRGSRAQLLLVAHHLVVDVASWGIIVDDLATLLATSGTGAGLPPRTASVLDWSHALVEWTGRPDAAGHASYWTSREVPGAWATVPVDLGAPDSANTVATAAVHEVALDHDISQLLTSRGATPNQASLHQYLMAALLLAWHRWSGESGLQLDVESMGRDALRGLVDVTRTVGWFTASYPSVLEMAAPTPGAALDAARAADHGVPLGGAAYGMLRYLHPDPSVRRALARVPRSALLFNYLGSLDGTIPADAPFTEGAGPVGAQRAPGAPRAYVLEINAWRRGGRFVFAIEYSSALHRPETVAAFGEAIRKALEDLVATPAPSGPTFDLVDLDDAGLGRVADLLADLDEG